MYIAVLLSLYMLFCRKHHAARAIQSRIAVLGRFFGCGLPRRSKTTCTWSNKSFRDNPCMFALMDFAKIAENVHNRTDWSQHAFDTIFMIWLFACGLFARLLCRCASVCLWHTKIGDFI
jgi:hypothetical protein